jgi:N-acetyltransferase 10
LPCYLQSGLINCCTSKDVHARYRTAAHDDVVARFNERFILSLGSCDDCLVLDDELNVLPISRGKDITPIEDSKGKGTKAEGELKDLKASLSDTKPVGDIIQLARTLDQASPLHFSSMPRPLLLILFISKGEGHFDFC